MDIQEGGGAAGKCAHACSPAGEKGAAEPSKGTVKAPGGTTKISVDIDDIFASGAAGTRVLMPACRQASLISVRFELSGKKKQQQQKEVATSAGEGGQGQEGKPRPAKVKGSKDDLFGEGGAEVPGRTEVTRLLAWTAASSARVVWEENFAKSGARRRVSPSTRRATSRSTCRAQERRLCAPSIASAVSDAWCMLSSFHRRPSGRSGSALPTAIASGSKRPLSAQ